MLIAFGFESRQGEATYSVSGLLPQVLDVKGPLHGSFYIHTGEPFTDSAEAQNAETS